MARGYNTRADALSTTIDGTPLDNVWADFQTILDQYNNSRDGISALFTSPTTVASEPVAQTIESAEFELASEFGLPQAFRVQPDYLQMGYPLQWFDIGLRYTEAFLRDAPREQLNALHNTALEADNRNTFKSVMRSIYTKTDPSTRLVNELGVAVYSLWDGASDAAPPPFAGKKFDVGHQHYLTTKSAQADGLSCAALIRTVLEHGYGTGNGECVVLLVNPQEGEVIRGFRAGSTSPYDFVPSESAPAFLSSEAIVGEKAPGEFQGMPVIGSFGAALVIEDYYAPPSYMCAVAVSPTRAPVAFRQHTRPEYRGLRLIPGNKPGPYLFDSTYANGFGHGIRHRGAAACMQVTTANTYSNPTI